MLEVNIMSKKLSDKSNQFKGMSIEELDRERDLIEIRINHLMPQFYKLKAEISEYKKNLKLIEEAKEFASIEGNIITEKYIYVTRNKDIFNNKVTYQLGLCDGNVLDNFKSRVLIEDFKCGGNQKALVTNRVATWIDQNPEVCKIYLNNDASINITQISNYSEKTKNIWKTCDIFKEIRQYNKHVGYEKVEIK